MTDSSLQLIATATAGLEAVVSRELDALGYPNSIPDVGRITFQGDKSAICKTNLWLRAADRVLLQVGQFQATDFGELYDQTHALPWEHWITANAYFPVNGRSIKSQLSSVPACQKIVKKAIVDKLKASLATDRLVDLPDQGPQCVVEIALRKDTATLTLDTTGPGLHKRGYRKLTSSAPLKETMAAGLVLLSFWDRDKPLVDPFCGSGTIVIEAAMIGRNIAPGLNRSFASETWPAIAPSLWQTEREKAKNKIQPTLPRRLLGTDHDPEVLGYARYHAKQAGVEDDVHFMQRDFIDLTSKQEYGCLVTNPPYGQRLADDGNVAEIYDQMPHVLARLRTWSHYVLTAYPHLEKIIGQEADRRRKLYNAQIKCTYYQFHGPGPSKEGAGLEDKDVLLKPAFGGLPDRAQDQATLFANRLQKRARHLRKWPTKQGIGCYRLYERDVPEVPLVVDRYEDCLHLAEYERPNAHTYAQHLQWIDLMKQTAAQTLGVDPKNVFMKYRKKQRGVTQHERFSQENKTFVVLEDGLKFKVNLSDYVDTGLFLDHRNTRAMIRKQAKNTRFLNLFGYTGSFTVYAAAGGASQTTTVDLSHTYLDWAQENLSLNGYKNQQDHQLVRADAMTFLAKQTAGKNGLYDLAVVDPPTFSNSKTTDEVWDIQKNHVDLLNTLAKLMSPGATIYFSTNSKRFKLESQSIQGMSDIRNISKQTVPDDFRNKRIHQCWRLTCNG